VSPTATFLAVEDIGMGELLEKEVVATLVRTRRTDKYQHGKNERNK
jgi:hypothetical protein